MAMVEFDSFSAMARAYLTHCGGSGGSSGWLGGMSAKQSAEMILAGGNDQNVAEAKKICDRIESEIDSIEREIAPSPFGGYAVIPEAINGYPLSMRRMVPNEDDGKPIRVYVCNTCSGGVEASHMMKRGIAVLALVMELQKFRPVELFCITTLGTNYSNDWIAAVKTKLTTTPLNLAEASHVLTHISVERGMGYQLAYALVNGNGRWPKGFDFSNQHGKRTGYAQKIRDYFGMTDDDIYLPPTWIGDDLVTRPVEWINEIIHHHNEGR